MSDPLTPMEIAAIRAVWSGENDELTVRELREKLRAEVIHERADTEHPDEGARDE